MTELELQQRVLQAYGIRVEPEMCRYMIKKLQQAGTALRELPVIGGEAKTGLPVRQVIDPAVLEVAAK